LAIIVGVELTGEAAGTVAGRADRAEQAGAIRTSRVIPLMETNRRECVLNLGILITSCALALLHG
jgi:hypothetical protein